MISRQYDDESMLPEKDIQNIAFDKKQQHQQQLITKSAEANNALANAPTYGQHSAGTTKIKCPNNFSYSNMSSNNLNIENKPINSSGSNLNSQQNEHVNLRAHANGNYASHPDELSLSRGYLNNMHYERHLTHLVDRTSTYSNSSRYDNSSHLNISNEQNVNQSVIKRDTEIERCRLFF